MSLVQFLDVSQLFLHCSDLTTLGSACTVYTTSCGSGKEHVPLPHLGWQTCQWVLMAVPELITAAHGEAPIREDCEELGEPSQAQVRVTGPRLSPRGEGCTEARGAAAAGRSKAV